MGYWIDAHKDAAGFASFTVADLPAVLKRRTTKRTKLVSALRMLEPIDGKPKNKLTDSEQKTFRDAVAEIESVTVVRPACYPVSCKLSADGIRTTTIVNVSKLREEIESTEADIYKLDEMLSYPESDEIADLSAKLAEAIAKLSAAIV